MTGTEACPTKKGPCRGPMTVLKADAFSRNRFVRVKVDRSARGF
jgi:hypothetical protein